MPTAPIIVQERVRVVEKLIDTLTPFRRGGRGVDELMGRGVQEPESTVPIPESRIQMAESIENQIQEIKLYTPRLETLKRPMPTATSTAAENFYPSLEAVKRTMPTATSTAAAPFGPH